MSSYNLPLEINYQPFLSTDLAGQGPYVSGFPAIMGAMSDAAYQPNTSRLREVYDTSLYGIPPNALYQRKKWIYICKGPQHAYAAPGKSFTEGQDIRIYNSAAVASTKSVVAARVISYDARTGLLWFDVYSILMGSDNSTGELNRIPTSLAVVTCFAGKQTIDEGTGYPRSIATGGTGGSSDRDGLTQLTSRNIIRVAEYMNDFISPAEGPVDVYNDLSVRMSAYGNAASTPSAHPGVIKMNVSAGAGNVRMNAVINKYPGIHNAEGGASVTGSAGLLVGSYWEFDVYIPALSTAVNEYIIEIGGTSSLSLPNHTLYFKYQRTSSVNWIIAASGSPFVSSTTATAVSTGWNRLRITRTSSSVFTFNVNGTNIGTLSPSSFDNQGPMGAYIQLDRSAGTSPTIEWDYFYALHLYSTDRGL